MLIASFILAVAAYLILCYGILFKDAVQPMSATMLWFVLDGLAAWTEYKSGGSGLLPLGYVVGCVAAGVATIWKGKVTFAKSDLWVTLLVLFCVAVWLIVGSVAGLIASSLAVFVAGIPLLIHYDKRPEDGHLSAWLVFSVANVLGLIGGLSKGHSLENWFFPVCALTGSTLTVALISRKWKRA